MSYGIRWDIDDIYGNNVLVLLNYGVQRVNREGVMSELRSKVA